MTKKDLADVIHKWQSRPTKTFCMVMIDRIFNKIRNEMMEKGEARVHGLGLFKVVWRKPRNCYDPTKGKVIELRGKPVIKFYPDKLMKKAILLSNIKHKVPS